MKKKPNLLFIMTDQQRFDALGCNGNKVIKTPHLDQLASEGANIKNYFTNTPVCVPSRCTLFTGRYLHSHRVRENYTLLEPGREMHLFRILKQEGYKLGYTGKNHLLEDPEKVNFDMFSGRGGEDLSEGEKSLKAEYNQNIVNHGWPAREIWRAGYVHDRKPEDTRAWNTVQAGVEFLEEQSEENPFCLCVSFNDPHVSHLAMREIYEQYSLDDIDLKPFGGEEELKKKAKRWLIKYKAFNAAAASEEDMKHYIAVYYAMITWVDRQIGRLLEKLKEKHLDKDTLIVFTADHGDFNFEHGLAKKDLVLMNSLLHVPLIIKWSHKIKPQSVEKTMVEQVDVLPTVLDLLNIEVPMGVQGRSFAPLLKGETQEHKKVVFAEICPPYLYNIYPDFDAFSAHFNNDIEKIPFNVPGDFNKSIREEGFRYIWYGTGEEELYDQKNDPHELNNLAHDATFAKEKNRLKMRLLEWNALTEDPLDSNIQRELQAKYNNWTPLSFQPGKMEGPEWRKTIHMNLAKPV